MIGLAGGPAADGVDAALVALRGRGERFKAAVLATLHRDFPPELQSRVQEAQEQKALTARELAMLDRDVAMEFSALAAASLDQARQAGREVACVGSGGVVLARVPATGRLYSGAAVQAGGPAILARQLGLPVVADFAADELAAGGTGGQAAAWADWIMLKDKTICRVLVHLGGLAEMTFLPAGGGPGEVLAFDAGPGTMVLDGLARRLFDRPFDCDGLLAAQGRVCPALLNELLAHPYFQCPLPRRTSPDEWGKTYLERLLLAAQRHRCQGADVLATATELVARCVAGALPMLMQRPHQLVLAGGGARNIHLAVRLRTLASPSTTVTSESFGLDARVQRAAAFAVLAAARMDEFPLTFLQASGQTATAMLGAIHMP